MSAGLSGFALSRWMTIAFVASRGRKRGRVRLGATLALVLPVLVVIGSGLWLVLPLYGGDAADGDPSIAATPAAVETPPSAGDTEAKPSTAPAEQPSATGTVASPATGLRISAQSWRRAGLGSNAQVTFTLRNDNDYAVKDVEIACAFARRDGSHLTDRRRMIPETLSMKSRKRFARLHVGFVNIHADRIKCQVVAASRI
jgi:hypothetical protein